MELSKSAALILALVAETPMSAYDMVKMLAAVNVRRWFSISDSSVYVTVKTLEKKNLIIGRNIREGSMPEKTLYSITEKGKDILQETLQIFLRDADASNPGFDIATLFLCHMDREEVLRLLRSREARLITAIDFAEGRLRTVELDRRVPFIGRVMIRHNLYLKEAELKTIQELLREIPSSDSWNFFVSKDLKS